MGRWRPWGAKGTSLSNSLLTGPLRSLWQDSGWKACLCGSYLQLKQNPSPRLSGAGVSQGIVAMSKARRVLCCAACARWQCQHLTPTVFSCSLAQVWPSPHLLGTDFLFGVVAGVFPQTPTFASIPQLHTDRCPCAFLGAPSQHSFLPG